MYLMFRENFIMNQKYLRKAINVKDQKGFYITVEKDMKNVKFQNQVYMI